MNGVKIKKIKENKIKEKKKEKKIRFLGKKRKLKDYKTHSLVYNELGNLLNGKNIKSNINTFNEYIKISENIIKGDFIGSFSNGDFLIEKNDPNNPLNLQYTIYSQSFKQKNIFIENRGWKFFLIGNNYGGYFNITFIKIYLFFNNNTQYKIIQKIIFPENFPHDVIFPFRFTHNNDIYFFLKYFSYENSKITLYKLIEKNTLNDGKNKIFEESEVLSLDFPFIWFAQKNNNELLFFKEEEDIFELIVYNFEEKKVINHRKINLIKLVNPRVANYVNKVLYNKYLLYSNENILFIIDVDNMEIKSVLELNNIFLINISDDNIIWTIERRNKYEYLNNHKRKKYQYNYLIQYILDKNYLELIKIGERPIVNNFVKHIFPLNNEKILLFVEKNKVELLKSKK